MSRGKNPERIFFWNDEGFWCSAFKYIIEYNAASCTSWSMFHTVFHVSWFNIIKQCYTSEKSGFCTDWNWFYTVFQKRWEGIINSVLFFLLFFFSWLVFSSYKKRELREIWQFVTVREFGMNLGVTVYILAI